VALGEALLVHADLPSDEVEALVEVADLRGHAFPVLTQEGEPFLLVAASLPNELGIAADPGERHAGGAEAGAELQPLDVLLAVDPVPVEPASHRIGEEALAFVEAQRVHAHSRAFGDVSDAQARFDLSQSFLQGELI